MPLPITIISGGQTGADRAGLDFALAKKMKTGGWCPRGRICDDGIIPARYALQETPADDYPMRTRWNVRDSDATIIFCTTGAALSQGCALTARCCESMSRPYLLLRTPDGGEEITPEYIKKTGAQLAEFLAAHQPEVVNIAGNRERKSPGMHQLVMNLLGSAWAQYEDIASRVAPAPEQTDFFLGVFAGHETKAPRRAANTV